MITFIVCNIVAIWICLMWMVWWYFNHPHETYIQVHEKLNTTPELLDSDFESSGVEVEDGLAKHRKTMVRTDQQGPNAKVHRPKQIGPKVNGPKYFGR